MPSRSDPCSRSQGSEGTYSSYVALLLIDYVKHHCLFFITKSQGDVECMKKKIFKKKGEKELEQKPYCEANGFSPRRCIAPPAWLVWGKVGKVWKRSRDTAPDAAGMGSSPCTVPCAALHEETQQWQHPESCCGQDEAVQQDCMWAECSPAPQPWGCSPWESRQQDPLIPVLAEFF